MKRVLFFVLCLLFAPAFMIPSDGAAATIDAAKKAIRMHDYAKAAQIYRELAAEGNPDALYELGSLYRLGRGVPKNKRLGFAYTLKAARLDHVKAQYSVGALYEVGSGTAKDIEKARYWFSKAASNGNPLARKKLESLEKGQSIVSIAATDKALQQAFFAAARKDEIKALDEILQHGLPIDARDDTGRTALMEAAAVGAIKSVSFLIGKRAKLDLRDNSGDTALTTALRNRHFSVATSLVQAGSDVNVADRYGNTPLILAAKEGAMGFIKLLLAKDAKPQLTNIAGQNAADIALARKHSRTLSLLKKYGVQPQTEKSKLSVQKNVDELIHEILEAVRKQKGLDRTPLMLASQLGKAEIIEPLVRSGEKINALSRDGFSAIGLAAASCHKKVLNKLISLGADVNLRPNGEKTPLMLAAEKKGASACVKRLLAAGAKVDETLPDGSTALMMALEQGHLKSAKYLLDAGARINTADRKGATPLIHAVVHAPRIVPQLLSKGARIRPNDSMGRTALWHAAKAGRLDVLQILLNYGADFSASDARGMTPLHVAVREGHLEIVDELIRRKADIEAKTNDGNTPLMMASSSGHLSIIKTLVQSGARLNTKNKVGDTAILMAAKKGDEQAVGLLLKLGANPNIRNDQNDNVRKVAEMRGFRKILQLLE